ncbi:hypothetical protein BKA80DRAFT_261236 [Phyllosticta citrichinensis]
MDDHSSRPLAGEVRIHGAESKGAAVSEFEYWWNSEWASWFVWFLLRLPPRINNTHVCTKYAAGGGHMASVGLASRLAGCASLGTLHTTVPGCLSGASWFCRATRASDHPICCLHACIIALIFGVLLPISLVTSPASMQQERQPDSMVWRWHFRLEMT